MVFFNLGEAPVIGWWNFPREGAIVGGWIVVLKFSGARSRVQIHQSTAHTAPHNKPSVGYTVVVVDGPYFPELVVPLAKVAAHRFHQTSISNWNRVRGLLVPF